MVAVQNLAGTLQIEVVLTIFVPRQFYQQFQVVELYRIVGRHGIGAAQFLQFLFKQLFGFFVPFLFGCFFF